MGFTTVRTGTPDDAVLDVIQAILTGGRTGRLYKKLVEGEEVAADVSANNNSGRYPGWFGIQVEILPDKNRAAVEKTVLAELKKLADEDVSAAELKRAKQGVLADAIFSRESVHGLADSIARGVTVDDLDQVKSYLPRIVAVTADDVKRVAGKYLRADERVVVWSLPKKAAALARTRREAPGGPAPARRR